MTINISSLASSLLAKFQDASGTPVKGRIKPPSPASLAIEVADLNEMAQGELWIGPGGTRVCDFIFRGKYCIAFAASVTDELREQISDYSEHSVDTIDVPGTLFLYLAHRLGLRPHKIDGLYVEEFISGPASDGDGVDISVLKENLEEVNVFAVNDRSIFHERATSKYVCNYICTFLNQSCLSETSIGIIRELFLQEEKRHLIDDNLFEAMRTPLLKHAFLEVYRTLEFVFVLPRTNSLITTLKKSGTSVNINAIDFARHCYKELGWKRVEQDAIDRLFREYASVNLPAFVTLCHNSMIFRDEGLSAGATPEYISSAIDKVSRKFYKLRNQVAHQFWPDEEIKCTDAEWKTIIDFTLRCVSHFYDQYLRKSAA